MKKMGSGMKLWRDGAYQTIEFVVTQECNMRCKYCYMTKKNGHNVLSYEVACRAIDYLLGETNRGLFLQDALAINFIGGEPLLEIDLIDRICDYFKIRAYELNHKWFDLYSINIGTNGILYGTEKVQRFLKKNKEKVSINITIDGIKEKHDAQRIYPNGMGTFDDVLHNVKMWLEQFPSGMTKATFSHEDLPYLADSIVFLWKLGMKYVPANIVFEDVWEEGDDELFYQQLCKLADYVVENDLSEEYDTSFFSYELGKPLTEEELKGRECGTGTMISIDANGVFYPCVRFMDYSLEHQPPISIGSIHNGLDLERLRSFVNCDLEHQSSKMCIDCSVASQCTYCLGHNYDLAGTLFERNKCTCFMHKANVRANNYYWAKLEEKRQEPDWEKKYYKNNLFIMLAEDSVSNCGLRSTVSEGNTIKTMSNEVLQLATKFTDENFFNPVILHGNNPAQSSMASFAFQNQRAFHILEAGKNQPTHYRSVFWYNHDLIGESFILNSKNSAILQVQDETVAFMAEDIVRLLSCYARVNVVLSIDYHLFDFIEYERQLDILTEFLTEQWNAQNTKEVNVLTDSLMGVDENHCGAGINSFTLAPNGLLYICREAYMRDESSFVGDLKTGIDKAKVHQLYHLSSPVCEKCGEKSCTMCPIENKKITGEYNTPASFQCKKTAIEHFYSQKMYDALQKELLPFFVFDSGTFVLTDPLERLTNMRGNNKAYSFPDIKMQSL